MLKSPYNLNQTADKPTRFYDDLALFTQLVITKGRQHLKSFIDDYNTFAISKSLKRYSKNEYVIELLMAGTYWNNYKNKLSIDALLFTPLFNELYSIRNKYSSLKNRVDNYRGRLAFNILAGDKNKHLEIYQRFEYLNAWLNCTKEYNQELERLENWKLFIECKHIDVQKEFWKNVELFASWFEQEAEKQLGTYTSNWSEFIMDAAGLYKEKENYFFCTRKPNEYHLNMVAAQILNNTLKAEYTKTDKKVVLLPKCMVKSQHCKAVNDGTNIKCANCTHECNVARLTNDLNKKGIEVVIIPHSLGFSKYLKNWENSKDTALIGVACTLNLISGGYEMQKLNIPSQCVFLDSCGCKKHWKNGNPTQINNDQLNNLILTNEPIKQSINSTC